MKLNSLRQILFNIILISIGSLLAAVSINGILVPMGFFSSGVIGISIILHAFIPSAEVGLIYLLMNIPIFILAWFYVGRRFFFYSITGLIIFSILTSVIHPTIHIEEKILAAILAGLLSGAGNGIVLRSLGSTGGLDIFSVIMLKRFSVKLGNTILAFNGLVLTLAAILFSIEASLYTLIFMYINTKVLNLVVTGLSQRKSAIIISSCWEEIARRINSEINRGVTVVNAEGGYSKKSEKVLYTVFTIRELARLKQIVKQIDPNAFVVINETLEVMGSRIGNQPHW